AREVAPEALKLFSARQIAMYAGGLDPFPDPGEQLREALAESQKKKGKGWTDYRDDVAYQAGWLVGGLDSKKEQATKKAAIALLNKAAKMDESEFSKSRSSLENSIKSICKVGPPDVIRHFMERLLAETLSNHRLVSSVEARLVSINSNTSE